MITDLLSDSFIENSIKTSPSPPPGKTSGAELRELIKLLRDRLTAKLNSFRGAITTHYFRPASAISEYDYEQLIGSDWIMVFRENSLELISVGNPMPDQVKYSSLEGSLTFGTALEPGELLTIVYSKPTGTGSSENTGFPYTLPLTF